MIQDNSATFPPSNTPVVDQKYNLTIPWMGFLRALFNRTGMGTGIPFQVQQIDRVNSSNVTADWVLANKGTGDGNLFLPSLSPGQFIVVQVAVASGSIAVTPQAGVTLDGGASYSLAGGKMQLFWCFTTTQIFSTQLG